MRRFLFAILASSCAVGCSRDLPDLQPYVAPATKPLADKETCESLSKKEGASWSPLDLTVRLHPGAKLAIGDASTLGGPFEPPLRVEAPDAGVAHVRALLGTTRGGEGRPLCIEVRLREGAVASFRRVADVVIDSDLIAIVDEQRYLAAIAKQSGFVFAGVEADATQMPQILEKTAAKSLVLDPLLPTYAHAMRPLQQGDRAIIEDALRETKATGRYLADAGMPAYAFLKALKEKPIAEVELAGEPDVAVAVESTNGDGAYVAALGLDASGATVTVEVRLAP